MTHRTSDVGALSRLTSTKWKFDLDSVQIATELEVEVQGGLEIFNRCSSRSLWVAEQEQEMKRPLTQVERKM
jgi:hypothetical protein